MHWTPSKIDNGSWMSIPSIKSSWGHLQAIANDGLKGGFPVSWAEWKCCTTVLWQGNASKYCAYQAHDANPMTRNQDPWWLGWILCNAKRRATESHCMVFQGICWCHRVRQSRSVFQLSPQCKIPSVECSSNSTHVFSVQQAAVYMVHCTWFTRWRKHKPPGQDTVHPWMGRSPDSDLKLTAWCISAWLKCLFIIVAAELIVPGILPFVQTLAAGSINHTTDMMIGKETHYPLMQPMHDGSYHQASFRHPNHFNCPYMCNPIRCKPSSTDAAAR